MNNEHENELNVGEKLIKCKKKLNKIGLFAIIFIVVILAIFVTGYIKAKNKYETVIAGLEKEVERLSDPIAVYEEASKEVTVNLIEAEIKDIGELATIEYLYTDAGKYEDARQLFGTDVPFTKKSFIAKWDGVIKAGVKIEEVIVEINDADKEIIIHIPSAQILSHEIDNDSIETLDEKDTWFNEIKVEDVRNFDFVAKDAMEKRAIENGILDKAFENAKEIIGKLVNNDVVQEQGYTVDFEEIK